jgi:hypothetical protein
VKTVEPGDWVMIVRIEDGDTEAAARKWAEQLVGMHGLAREVRGDSWARVRLDEAVDRRPVWRISLLDLELWTPPRQPVRYVEILCCGVAGDRGRVLHAITGLPSPGKSFPTLCGLAARGVRQGRRPLPWSASHPRTCMQCSWLAPLTRARDPDRPA